METPEVTVYRQIPVDVWENKREELTTVLLGDLYKELAEKHLMPIGVVGVDVRPVTTYEGEYCSVRARTATTYPLMDYQRVGESDGS